MKKKTTDDLCNELMGEADLDSYIRNNQGIFFEGDVSVYLLKYYKEGDFTKAELARRSGISEVYLHQVFSGRRKPSRDRLLCICIGMGIELEDVQQLLKQVGYAQLYPKLKRDAIMIYGIAHHILPSEINDRLFAENEKTLF